MLVFVANAEDPPEPPCGFGSFLDAIPGSSIFSDTSIFKEAIKLSGYEVRLDAFATDTSGSNSDPPSKKRSLNHRINFHLHRVTSPSPF